MATAAQITGNGFISFFAQSSDQEDPERTHADNLHVLDESNYHDYIVYSNSRSEDTAVVFQVQCNRNLHGFEDVNPIDGIDYVRQRYSSEMNTWDMEVHFNLISYGEYNAMILLGGSCISQCVYRIKRELVDRLVSNGFNSPHDLMSDRDWADDQFQIIARPWHEGETSSVSYAIALQEDPDIDEDLVQALLTLPPTSRSQHGQTSRYTFSDMRQSKHQTEREQATAAQQHYLDQRKILLITVAKNDLTNLQLIPQYAYPGDTQGNECTIEQLLTDNSALFMKGDEETISSPFDHANSTPEGIMLTYCEENEHIVRNTAHQLYPLIRHWMNPEATRQISITFLTGEMDESNPSLLQRLQSPIIAPPTPDTTTPSHSPPVDINAHLIRAGTLCLGLTQDQIDNNQPQIDFSLNMLESLEFALRQRHSSDDRGQQTTIRNLAENMEALTEVIGAHSSMMEQIIDSFFQVAQQSDSPPPPHLTPSPHSNRSQIYYLGPKMIRLSLQTNFLSTVLNGLQG